MKRATVQRTKSSVSHPEPGALPSSYDPSGGGAGGSAGGLPSSYDFAVHVTSIGVEAEAAVLRVDDLTTRLRGRGEQTSFALGWLTLIVDNPLHGQEVLRLASAGGGGGGGAVGDGGGGGGGGGGGRGGGCVGSQTC